MVRLPQPGGDKGSWGEILNSYLREAHNDDGSLKNIPQSKITDLQTDLAAKANTSAIPTTPAQVGAEPVGLSQATKDELNASIATQVIAATNKHDLMRRGGAYINALASRESSRFVAWFLGDSNLEGSGLSTRWFNLFGSLFTSAFPTSGVTGWGKYIPVRYENSGKPSPWTFSKPAEITFDTTGQYGFGGRSVTMPKFAIDASTITMTTTVDQGGYGQVLHPTGAGGGGYEVRVNGVLAQTAPTPSSTPGEGGSNNFNLVAGDIVEIRAQSSGIPAKINGLLIVPSTPAKGITLIEAGHAGWSAVDYVAAQVTSRPTLGYLGSLGSQLNPDLVVIPLSINDYSQKRTPAQYKAALLALIAAVRTGVNGVNTTFVLVSHVDSGQVAGPAAPWEEYVAVARSIAAEDVALGGQSGVIHMDLGDYMIDPAISNAYGYFTTDKVHFTTAGNWAVARAFMDALNL